MTNNGTTQRSNDEQISNVIDRTFNKLESGVEIAGALLGVDMSDSKADSTEANKRGQIGKSDQREIAAAPAVKALAASTSSSELEIQDAEIVEPVAPVVIPAPPAPSFTIKRSRNLSTNAIEFLVLGDMCHVSCPSEAHAIAVRDALAKTLAEAKKAA